MRYCVTGTGILQSDGPTLYLFDFSGVVGFVGSRIFDPIIPSAACGDTITYLKNKDQGSGQGMQRRKRGAYR